jgi:hypothetical protein
MKQRCPVNYNEIRYQIRRSAFQPRASFTIDFRSVLAHDKIGGPPIEFELYQKYQFASLTIAPASGGIPHRARPLDHLYRGDVC